MMKSYGINAIRNLGLFGHQGSGKTSLAEAMLYTAGAIDRQGRTEDGTSICDFDPEEHRRHISINIAVATCEWADHKINILDVPGYLDFQGEVRAAMAVIEAAILVTPAQNEPEVGFAIAWELAAERNLPRAVFVNRMDRENADYGQVIQALRGRYGTAIAPVQLPIGSADGFKGVVDLLEMKAILGQGKNSQMTDIPAECQEEANRYREILIESAAEGDDELVMKFLEGEELTHDEIIRGLHEGINAGKVVPVLCGSAARAVGVSDLLDIIVHEFPTPLEIGHTHGRHPQSGGEETREMSDTAPLAALVFKTIADPFLGTLSYFRVISGVFKAGATVLNATRGREERVGQVYFARGKNQEPVNEIHAGDIGVTAKLADTRTGDTLCDPAKPILLDGIPIPEPIFELAIHARTKVDEDKLGPALNRVAVSDPTFRYHRDAETSQTIISGSGETHLSIVVERLKKFQANVDIIERKVAYRETVTGKAEGQGRHKKQTGGRGQFGDCWLRIEPNRGNGVEFVDMIVGGAIPRNFIPAVEKGVRQAAETGILAGYAVVDVRVSCYDGSYHDVDSSEAAFVMAGIIGFNNVAGKANPILLEPIFSVDVFIPEGMLGDVMSDLTGKRGRIVGTESLGNGRTQLKAVVPQSEMLRYAIDLRSITRGRGTFRMEHSHYEEVPAHIAQNIIANHKKEREAAEH